jgi:hypothetical protein
MPQSARRRCIMPRLPVPNNVGLMVGLSCHLAGHRPIEVDSAKTYGFLTRKKRPVKGTGISDEPGGPLFIRWFVGSSRNTFGFSGTNRDRCHVREHSKGVDSAVVACRPTAAAMPSYPRQVHRSLLTRPSRNWNRRTSRLSGAASPPTEGTGGSSKESRPPRLSVPSAQGGLMLIDRGMQGTTYCKCAAMVLMRSRSR